MREENRGKERTGRPLSFCHIGTPFLPISGAFAILLESLLLLSEIFMVVYYYHDRRPGQILKTKVCVLGVREEQAANSSGAKQRKWKKAYRPALEGDLREPPEANLAAAFAAAGKKITVWDSRIP